MVLETRQRLIGSELGEESRKSVSGKRKNIHERSGELRREDAYLLSIEICLLGIKERQNFFG